jgi:SPX domain protein involved in polyphosphate accumulation
MKFGTQLELYKIPEWASKYLDFLILKKKLKRISRTEHPQHTSFSVATTQDLLDSRSLSEDWLDHFHKEIAKINEFYCTKRLEFIRELEDICAYVLKNHDHSMLLKSDHFDPRLRLPSLLRAVQKSHRNLWCLEVYCEINYLGCVK